MAGDDDADGVVAHGLADALGQAQVAHLSCNRAVGRGSSIGKVEQDPPHPLGELIAVRHQRHVELLAFTGQILSEFSCGLRQQAILVVPFRGSVLTAVCQLDELTDRIGLWRVSMPIEVCAGQCIALGDEQHISEDGARIGVSNAHALHLTAPALLCSDFPALSGSVGRVRRVAVVVLEGAKPLDVGIPAQVFTTRESMPYSVQVCGVRSGLVPGADGLSYHVEQGLEALGDAELIFLPGYLHPDTHAAPEELLIALREAHARGARIAAISTGAFALAATGLLDGKRATTHWHYTRVFSEQFPEVELNQGVLFVDEGSVLTSAGAASGIDLCLHILRSDLGLAAANHAARRLVAAPYRSGGQAQFVPHSVPASNGERFAETRAWALAHLHEPLAIDRLAGHAMVSPRTFSRVFREETGYTPMRWIMRARLDLARELLENTRQGVDEIAAEVGLGTGANLRLHFRAVLGTTPSEYRRTFAKGE